MSEITSSQTPISAEIALVVLFFASFFDKAVSDTMCVIMTRQMGMILLAILIEMVVAGNKATLPGPA